MTWQLETDYAGSIPLEVEGILPEQMAGKSLDEIRQMPIVHGNRQVPLGEFFQLSGDPGDQCLVWRGELSRVHWMGAGMTRGTMRIVGSAGRHVGSRMRGGRIEVQGDVSDSVGAEMLGGRIHVHGNTGHLAGAAYRGSARGMTGGTILIDGSAGNEVGHGMRRGLIAIAGSAGDLVGMNMLAGSIFVFGKVGLRHGAGMRRGTIGLLGSELYTPLPTFYRACRCSLELLRIVERTLHRLSFPLSVTLSDMQIDLYHGDMLEGGRGEMLLRSPGPLLCST